MSGPSNDLDKRRGPRSAAIFRKAQQCLPRAMVPSQPAVIESAGDALITDVDGNQLIDLYGGAGVNLLGHRNQRVQEAIERQLQRLWHAHVATSFYEPYVDLAAAIQRYCGGDQWKVVLGNTGAEAVENAVKLAQFYTQRTDVIVFTNGFHGRSWMTTALTGTARYKDGIGPFLSNVHTVPYPYCYRCPIKLDPASCGTACANLLSLVGQAEISPNRIAAVLIEPVLGEGGAVQAPRKFVEVVRRFCSDNGIVLIADEVQAGFGRTGAKFSLDHVGVTADIYVVGKAFGAGFPISAVVGRSDIMDAMPEGGIGGTFAGNPVICAGGVAAIEVIEDKNLLQRAKKIQAIAEEVFFAFAQRCPIVGDVRCFGALIGIELVRDRASREPAPSQAARVVASAARRGAVVGRGGQGRNVIRLLPPLVIEEDLLRTGFQILCAAIEEVAAEAS